MYKFLAAFLAFSLLIPHGLVASPAAEKNNPSTLAQYQQRAQKDIQKTPWLNKEGKIILSALGAGGTLLLLQHLYHAKKIKIQQRQHTAVLENMRLTHQQELSALKTEKAQIQKELGKTQKQVTKLNQEVYSQSNQATTWRQLYEGQLNKISRLENQKVQAEIMQQATELESKFLEEEWSFWKIFDNKKNNLNKEISEIATKLSVNQPLTTREIALLTEGMDDTFKGTFLKQINLTVSAGKKVDYKIYEKTILDFMRAHPQQFTVRTAHFIKKILKEMKGIIGITFLLFALTNFYDAQAQDITKRLQNNMNLFIFASPNDLALLEKDSQTRSLCIEISDLIHYMALLPQPEQQTLQEAFQEISLKKAPKQPNHNLANY